MAICSGGRVCSMLAATAIAGMICLPAAGVADGSLDELRERGQVRGAYVHEPPFGFLGPDGEPTGESVEMARAVLQQIGIGEFKGMMTERPSLIPGVNDGRWDMIAGGLRITPEHCDDVLFTDPTYRTGQAFLVQAGNPLNLNSYADLRQNDGAVLGVIDGTVQREYARIERIPAGRIEEVANDAELLSAVRGGRVDAGAATRITVQRLARSGGAAVQSAEPFITPPYGMVYGAFAFRKDQRELRDAVNQHLREFIGSEEHLELIAEFDLSRVNMPGRMTAEQLCERDIPTAPPQ